MKLTYWLTKEAIKRIFVEDGREIRAEQAIDVNAAEISKQAREWLAERGGRLTIPHVSPNIIGSDGSPLTSLQFETDRLVDTPEDVEALIVAHRTAYESGEAWANATIDAAIVKQIDELEAVLARPVDTWNDYAPRVKTWYGDRPLVARAKELAQQVTNRLQTERLSNISQRYQEYIANPSGPLAPIGNYADYKSHPDYPAVAALYEQAAGVSKAVAAEKDRAAAAEKAQRETEKREWIGGEFGSDHLKRAFAAGYDSQRRYVIERAAKEHPGYTVDFDDKAGWKSRSFPSEAALSEAERVNGEVVWLTSMPVDDGNPDEYQAEWDQECEAVVIRGYLGRYDLVKVM